MSWAARIIGVFYVVAGAAALRQMAFSWRLEMAYAKILPPAPHDRAADIVLTLGSIMVLMSGLALACLHHWSVPVFIAGWIIQAGYLLWAQRWNPPANVEMVGVRRHTIHALAAYSVVTVIVMALGYLGLLRG